MTLLDMLEESLADIDAHGLRRRRRTIDGPSGAHMTVDGREMIGFANNDYLGLAAHPVLVDALALARRPLARARTG
jgi:8-amino-7-oxononanoate synthase